MQYIHSKAIPKQEEINNLKKKNIYIYNLPCLLRMNGVLNTCQGLRDILGGKVIMGNVEVAYPLVYIHS